MAEITTASPNQDLEAIIERSQIALGRGLLAGDGSPGVYVEPPAQPTEEEGIKNKLFNYDGTEVPYYQRLVENALNTGGVYSGDPLYGLDIGVAPSTEEDAGNFFGFRINNKLFNPDTTVVTPRYQQEIENALNPGTGVAASLRTSEALVPDRTEAEAKTDESLAMGVKAAQYANREQEKGNFLENLLGQIDLNKLLNSKTVKLLLEGVAGMSGEQQRSGGSALSGFTTSLNQARADDQQAMLDEQDRLLEQSRYDASAAASQVVAARLARQDARAEQEFRERNDVNPVSLNKPTENFIKDMISNSRIVSAIVEERDGTWFSRRIGTSPTESEVINAIVSEVVKIQHSNRVPLAQAFSAFEQSVGVAPSSSNTSDGSNATASDPTTGGDAFGSIK
jgi:hypothetical protein